MRSKLIIGVFAIVFSLTMLRSGWYLENGYRLIGVNASDGIWNLALISELMNSFPPEHPGFAGELLKGYHFFYHILLAGIAKVTSIPVPNLYFHIFPLIISYLWGYGVYRIVVKLYKNKKAGLWSAFFSLFGGSFAFLLPLIWKQDLSINSGFGICQPLGCSLVNPAFASSIVLMIWSYYFLIEYLQTNKRKWAIWLIVATGISVGFKVYAGMILMGALAVAAVFRACSQRKFDLLIIFGLALLMAMAVFFPFNANYGFLLFQPLWPPHITMQGPLGFTRWRVLWELAEYNHNLWGIIKLEIWANGVFFLGNMGTRLLVIFALGKFIKRGVLKIDAVFYLTMLGISYLIPMFFLQPAGGVFNMVQMYWYFLFLVSILVGPGIVSLMSRINSETYKLAIYLAIIVLTLPSTATDLQILLTDKGRIIDNNQLEVLEFLRGYGDYDKTVLQLPELQQKYTKEELYGWFTSRSSTIIPALGGKRVYAVNEGVTFPDLDINKRLALIMRLLLPEKVCNKTNWDKLVCQDALDDAYNMLQSEDIRFIYSKEDRLWLDNWDKINIVYKGEGGSIYGI